MSPEHLAERLLNCLRANDLDGFSGLLRDPVAVEAVALNQSEVFWQTYRNHPMEFWVQVIPYVNPWARGIIATQYVYNNNPPMFELFAQSPPVIWEHLEPDALGCLAHRCTATDHFSPSELMAHQQFLDLFLDRVPESIVRTHLEYLRRYVNCPEGIVLVEQTLAQRQKARLEQEIIEKTEAKRGRKI